jgi:hypothetical protein
MTNRNRSTAARISQIVILSGAMVAGVGFDGAISTLRAQDSTEAAAPEAEATTIRVFDTLTLTVPKEWQAAPPKSRIVDHEFTFKHGEGDEAPTARVTMMAASGGTDANITRWKGQFSGAGEPKVEKSEAAGAKVVFVQLEGSFKDSMGGGPFAGGKTVIRENYGMLGGIIELKDGRSYFIKFTGPKETVEAGAEAFKEMLKGIKA